MERNGEEQGRHETHVLEDKAKEIVLHNDDVNTFEHVIVSLMEICDHDPLQAEQCAWLVHYKGRCSVKRGSFDVLRPLCEALCERGLSADIQ
ncbi:MAG: ATP-dependent Clp protease adaptor ClpS [Flavobacteriales bacterium]|nr:ATP-dependent Clp protease adaptor ClpS [Flavobacteriales bacterium]MBK6893810.1 ATP-dependent Clp protease adaptor ClpS [Flavobacteriales bacterium]MBK7247763.1 ATP-dependent Clp protease adaptor ClpS [Flavobacteriales bacterium]MBK7287943.1 ATP-dependent Clp protease adaptor ClpS [Flavobacteriales bacterium]MBK9060402.1 ATP-dependent Clp protease adaptor ClpS [Flavobacteriales bacterium]